MRDIVPRNSELIGVMPENSYTIKYQEFKGLAIDMRSETERAGLKEAKFSVKHPDISLLGGMAVTLCVNTAFDALADMPDAVQSGTSLVLVAGFFGKYIKDSKAQAKYNKQKKEVGTKSIFEIADNDPNVYFLPYNSVYIFIDEGEAINPSAQELFRTPDGRKLLTSMGITVDDKAGLAKMKDYLRLQHDALVHEAMTNDPYEELDADEREYRRQRREKAHALSKQIISFDYDHTYGDKTASDVNMKVTFSPAETVYAIIDQSLNKSQLILDSTVELQELSVLMQRYTMLSEVIYEIPYRDKELHSHAIAEIIDQMKEIGLQIVTVMAVIKQIALKQQAAILSGYANNIL